MSKKRGPKAKATIQAELMSMKKDRDELQGQLLRRESDFEQRKMSDHTEEVRKLKSTIETEIISRKSFGKKAARFEQEADIARAALTAERIATEGMRLETKRAAEKQFNTAMAVKQRMISARDMKIELLQGAVDTCKDEALAVQTAHADAIAKIEGVTVQRLSTIRRLSGKEGGAQGLSRTDAELAELPQARGASHKKGMMDRIGEVLGKVGTETEISMKALMDVLVRNGYLKAVWESEEIWELRMDWLEDARDDLALSWDADFSRRVRDKLVISYDKLDELRFMLSHHRVGTRLVPRTWVINPWTNDRINYPQPIRPRSGALGWARLISATQKRFGLTMDSRGRTAQRSYAQTVALQYARDNARGLLKPISPGMPLITVLGADGTGVGKRSMMHVASSIAPSYRDGVSVENEKNLNTNTRLPNIISVHQ